MKIIAVIVTTFAVAKRQSQKLQGCTGFESLTSTTLVQRSSNRANKPTGTSLWCQFCEQLPKNVWQSLYCIYLIVAKIRTWL